MSERSWFRSMLSFALLTLLTVASSSAQQTGKLSGGKLSFDAKATKGPFTGTTTTMTGEMTGGPDLSTVRGWVEAPVATLKTGNDHRDRDLNKSMETGKYPTMRFDLKGVTRREGSADSIPVLLTGDLLIHGVKRSVELPAWVRQGKDRAQVHSDFPLNVKDYKVGGLSKFFGLFTMDPDITVHVDLTFMPGRG
jgi:polyisoprenoid-binding protein YceI